MNYQLLTIQFWQLVLTKVLLNLKSEASKSYLSYLWWFLEPAMFVAVFYLVFGIFLARGEPDFVVFLVCGKIPFLWFSRSVSNSANSIVDGRGLMNQISIPKVFFPLVVVVQDLFKSSVVFGLMLLFLIILGVNPELSWITLPLIMLVQLIFVTSVALIGAALIPFLPDLKFIINTGIMLLMFASGIFYSYKDVLLAEHQSLFLLNPLANLIRIYREVLLEGMWPDWTALLGICASCLAVIVVTLVFYKKFDGRYPRLVLQ